jgi:predicted aspartyl protease
LNTGVVLLGLLGAACGKPATADSADIELRDYQLPALEVRVRSMPEGPERDYFSGMLSTRRGQFDDALDRLNRALPRLRESAPKRAAIALEAMATASRANNRYGDAARAYADLSDHFSGQLDRFPADDAALARILNGAPPQTIAWEGPVRLKTTRNPLGSRMAEVTVNGVSDPWLLDTGANQTVVTQSFAKRLGLTPLPGAAPAGSGLTGRTISIQAAVLPELHLGGATLSNVAVVIIEDASLRISNGADAYQINAVLGYPIFKALGVVTFARDEFRAGDAAAKNFQGAPMYMRGLTPAIECEVEGRPLLFTFDTGASSTELSVRYYELFREPPGRWEKHVEDSSGAGGSIRRDVYVQPRVVMKAGAATITLKDVSILPVRANAGIDVLFGNLGQDFIDSFESVSLDFQKMVFALGASR